MDRKLRNRIVLYLLLAVVLALVLIKLSGRKPAPKISAVTPVRENLTSSIRCEDETRHRLPTLLACLYGPCSADAPRSTAPDRR